MERTVSKFREFVWGLYDFADTIFSMNVVSLYFPLLVVSDLGGKDIYVGLGNSVSQGLVIFLAPLFGVLSDRCGRRMPFMTASVVLCALGTALIPFFATRKSIFGVVALFVLANLFYQLSLTFYNALLPRVGPPHRWGKISGLGTALGYVGSIVGMILVMPFNTGEVFGVRTPIPAGGRVATFLPTAALFVLFALPTLIYFFADEMRHRYPADESEISPLKKIFETLADTKKFPGVRRFVVARFFFQEGVETAIVFMGVFAEKVMGMPDSAKIKFFVVATTFAVVGSFLWGRISDSVGHHRSLVAVLSGWIAGLVALALFPTKAMFYAAGCWLGAMLGGVWTTSRPYILHLAPPEMTGRFFGLYSLSGKAAAVTGPLVWGATVLVMSKFASQIVAYKAAIFVLAGMIFLGLMILLPNRKYFGGGNPF